jgi:hypothetical protein
MRTVFISAAVLSFFSSCNGGSLPVVPVNTVAIHEPLSSHPHSLRLGQNCSVGGKDDCVSGVCLHLDPHPNTGHICTELCVEGGACAPGWACSSIAGIEGIEGRFCLPNRGSLSQGEVQ